MIRSLNHIKPALYAVIAFAFILLTAFIVDGETTGEVDVNPRLVRLGVPFTVTVEIESDENIQNPRVDFPEPDGVHLSRGSSMQGVNITRGSGGTEVSHVISREYTADEPGQYEIGPFRVTYFNSEGETEEIELEPVIVEIFEDAPREASTIIQGTMPWWWPYLITAICLAILAGLVAGWYALKRRRIPDEAAPAVIHIGSRSPEQIAYEAISKLEIPDPEDEEAVKEYYDAVDDILRVYLTRRYNMPTRDATLWEIRQEFTRRKRLDSRVKGVFEMMNDCDWVKFAKMEPSSKDIRNVKVRAADVLVGQKVEDTGGVA